MLFVAAALGILSACHPTRPSVGRPGVAGTPLARAVIPEPGRLAAPVEEAREIRQPARIGPVASVPKPGMAEVLAQINAELQDVFYPYDRADLSASEAKKLQHDAKLLTSILTEFPGVRVTVEGHCDERGSAEYNLALGDTRAARTADALRAMGLAATKLETVSYGKESPQCTDATESCWQRNRRGHLVVSPPALQ